MPPTTIDLDDLARRCDACFPALSGTERRIALAVYGTLARSGPAEVGEVARAAGVEAADVDEALGCWPGVYRDAEGRVVGFWGLALSPMDQTLVVNGRTLYGWCAWDTLFLPEILGATADVEATCPATGADVALEVGPHGPTRVEPPGAIVSFLYPDRADVERNRVLSSFCHHIRFLASREAFDAWEREAERDTFALTIEEAWELGRAVNRLRYGDALANDGDGGR